MKGEGAQDNRGRILEAAKELFYARGYDAVGVQEVVKKVGLTKPTLYHYFGSKQGLLEALLAAHFEGLRKDYQSLEQENYGIREKLYRLADIFGDFFEMDPEFYLLLMALFYSARENEAYRTVKPYVQEFYEMVVQVFERSSAELGNMNGRQRQFALGFTGVIGHFFLLSDGGELDRNQLRGIVNQFMHGIFS